MAAEAAAAIVAAEAAKAAAEAAAAAAAAAAIEAAEAEERKKKEEEKKKSSSHSKKEKTPTKEKSSHHKKCKLCTNCCVLCRLSELINTHLHQTHIWCTLSGENNFHTLFYSISYIYEAEMEWKDMSTLLNVVCAVLIVCDCSRFFFWNT